MGVYTKWPVMSENGSADGTGENWFGLSQEKCSTKCITM